MACGAMAVAAGRKTRLNLIALCDGNGASVGEPAAFGQAGRIRRITGDQDAFLRGARGFINCGDRRQQRLGVGMLRVVEQALSVRMFDDFAHVHHGD